MRENYEPKLPPILSEIGTLKAVADRETTHLTHEIDALFPKTVHQPFLKFASVGKKNNVPIKVGVVFSGGQASGGHNVLTGLLDAIKEIHPRSHLIGFLGGPSGIVDNTFIELSFSKLSSYRNQGGFDCIGSGRTKIETKEQFIAAEKAVREHDLDGLVIIGGDDSNTNAALLAEYFLEQDCKTVVVGVPKTIDGDLRSEDLELSFGFDTATKTYSHTIGSICRDALSAKKYTFFIKLMGRSASHIALECALNTQANLTLIGEEVAKKNQTLDDVVAEIADLICEREEAGKNYGVVLIPEGLVEFIPKIKEEVLFDLDAHGNIKVSQIETERFLIDLVKKELKKRGKGEKFKAQPLFCGYEGRCCYPTNFDCDYCYCLGFVAALLIKEKKTGYMACVKNLKQDPSKWEIAAIPLTSMIHFEERKGEMKPVIQKALVDLEGDDFGRFAKRRGEWRVEDAYLYPPPIQF